MFLAPDRDLGALVSETEADMRSGSMHPQAPYIWARARLLQGRLDDDWRTGTAADLRAVLGSLPDMFLADERSDDARKIELANAFSGSEGPWQARVFAGWRTDDANLAARLNRLSLADSDDEFVSLWDLLDFAGDLRATAIEAKQIIAARPNSDDLFSRVAREFLDGHAALSTARKLEIVDEWLSLYPRDRYALMFRAQQLGRLHRSGEALEAFRRAGAAFPYFSSQAYTLANYAVKVLPESAVREEVAAILKQTTALSAEELANLVDVVAAGAYRSWGDRGSARRILTAALERAPGDVGLNREMANLEMESDRPAEAERFATLASESPLPRKADLERSIKIAAGRGDPVLAETFAARFRERFGKLSVSAYYELGRRHESGSEQSIALGREALETLPDSDWPYRYLIDNLIKAGRATEATPVVDEWLSRFVVTTLGQQYLYLRYLKAVEEPDAALRKYAGLADRWGRYESFWQNIADEKASNAEKIAFWQEVRRKKPGKAFPVEKISLWLAEENRFDSALEVVDAARIDMAGTGGAELGAILAERCYLTARMDAREGEGAGDYYRRARADCLEAVRLGADRGAVTHSLARLSSVYADMENVVADWEEAVGLQPDLEDIRTLPFYHTLAKTVNTKKTFAGLHAWYERDPFDGDRIVSIADRHAKWGGSRIWAKLLYERLKTVAPDKFQENESAYDQINAYFESPADNFVKRYGSEKYISQSQRYVGWYDNARLKAQKPGPVVSLDPATFTKTVTQPDGQREIQTEDPVTGAILYRAKGTAWQRYHYDERGNLVRAEAPGVDIRFTYGEGDMMKRIEYDDIVLSFEHGPLGKPTKIILEGVGSLDVAYDEAGEIDKVSSSDGPVAAQRVTRAFQTILPMTKESGLDQFRDKTQEARAEALRERLMELWFDRDDPELIETVRALLPFIDGAGDDFNKVNGLLLGIVGDTGERPEQAARAILLLRDLYASIFPGGLARSQWERWQLALADLERSSAPAVLKARGDLGANPLVPLPDARWLARSNLANPGYWAKYELADYVPRQLRDGLRLRTLHAARDGRVIVATSAGLFIRQKGFWLRYLVDPRAGKLVQAPASEKASSLSDVLSIVEKPDGGLWLGTADGLVRLSPAGDIEARYQSAAEGLASRRVSHLVPWRDGVVAAGADGLSFFDMDGADAGLSVSLNAEGTPAGQEPAFVAALSADELLVGANGGVWLVTPGNPAAKLADLDARGALAAQGGAVFLAGTREVYRLERDENGMLGPLRPIEGRQDLQVSQSLYGLKEIAVDDDGRAVAVLSDLGIGFHRYGYVEHLALPLSSGQPAALALSEAGGSFWVASDGGTLYAFQRGQVAVDNDGPVHNIVTDPAGRVTYVARDGSIQAILHDGPPRPRYLFAANVRKMISAPNGILFNDGADIMRYRSGEELPELLFSARNDIEHYDSEEARKIAGGEVTGIALASDGAVWATTRTSVFRHFEGRTSEYSFFLSREKFPMPAKWIAGVYSTIDDRIWVVGSNEGHIAIDGTAMRGGLAEWNGDGFDLVGGPSELVGRPWFVTGYTRIGEGKAVIGSSGGMGQHETGRFAYVEALKESSYMTLLESHPNLFLGGRGAPIGGEVWLFPTGAGIVGLRNGEWFYPDRLNELLPDRHLARYGARMVHALDTDPNGRIYAGTDRGLLVFNTGGADAADFLMANGMRREAFERQEEESLQRQRAVFIKGLDADDPRARLAKRYLQLEDEISRLAIEQRLKDANALTERLAARTPESKRTEGQASEESADRLRKLVEQRERQMARVLLQLERDSQGMAQMLQMKPLDLAALQKEIPEGSVMVQYIPTGRKLFIHVVSREERSVREVEADMQALFAEARLARTRLQAVANELREGRGATSMKAKSGENAKSTEEIDRQLYDGLHGLYRQLVLPVEDMLDGYEHVYFVPSGALAEVPFSSLVTKRGERNRFLVEDHAVGLMPSLYLVHVYLTHLGSASEQMLIFGDPDGSLPGARKEAEEIRDHVPMITEMRIGDAADYATFAELGPLSRAVHLATHGVLDAVAPEESYLLLSGNRKLKLIDIQLMDFSDTDLVFLSACETGLGGQGIEFQTLSRAFAHAGVPTVAATLWQVSDAATLDLATRFYDHYEDDAVVAMAEAQRVMIAEGRFAHPAAWAGFSIMGMP